MNIRQFTPSVSKSILVLMAGTMWCGVGIMLISFSLSWLAPLTLRSKELFFGAGALAAIPIHHFGFTRIADKNLNRLMPLTEKRCLFSFITWRSYFTVLIMISLGITLRHSAIPKNYLSILYTAIGLALFLSGIKYLRFFVKLLATND
jgi:hypothetical protein